MKSMVQQKFQDLGLSGHEPFLSGLGGNAFGGALVPQQEQIVKVPMVHGRMSSITS